MKNSPRASSRHRLRVAPIPAFGWRGASPFPWPPRRVGRGGAAPADLPPAGRGEAPATSHGCTGCIRLAHAPPDPTDELQQLRIRRHLLVGVLEREPLGVIDLDL